MAENDSTTDQAKETLIKKEALAAIQNVKMILSGLAAIAVLRIHAAGASEGSDFAAWQDVYHLTPWVAAGEIPKGDLPQALEEGLNQIIFKQASQAWQELFEKAERVFGPEIYELLAVKEEAPEVGHGKELRFDT